MSATQEWLDVQIAAREAQTPEIVALDLRPAPGQKLPRFAAGAHVDVQVADGLLRQYSLCNDPAEEGRYRLGILLEPASRGGSAEVHRSFAVGRSIRISPPRNNFHLIETARRSILAGGGIGITPLLSMAWRLHALGADFALHYCTRSRARTAFLAELAEMPFADKVHLHFDDEPEAQRFTVEKYLSQPGPGIELYTCGPGGFMDYVTQGAKRLGWAEANVHLEYFSIEVNIEGDGFTVELARSGKTLVVPSGVSIADVLLKAGVDVPLSCEAGICGTCLTDVVSGTPDHRDMYQTDDEKASNKQITVCCSRSLTPKLVLDI